MIKLVATFILFLAALLKLPDFSPQDTDSVQALPVQNIAVETVREVITSTKSMDDPYLQTSLRLTLIRFLSKNDVFKESRDEQIRLIITQGFGDLDKNRMRLPEGLYLSLRKELEAFGKEYSVIFKTDTDDEKDKINRDVGDALDFALSMLNEQKIDPAVRMIAGYLNDPESKEDRFRLLMLFSRLADVAPDKMPDLLTATMTAKKKNLPSVSTDTLLTLKGIFSGQKISVNLKRAYISLLFLSIETDFTKSNLPAGSGNQAFIALNGMMPLIKEETPDLYEKAHYILQLVRNFAAGQLQDEVSFNARLENSTEPVDLLLAEAKKSRSDDRRQELIARAAQTARDKGKTEQAIDIITSSDNPSTKWSLGYQEQFLSEVINKSIEEDNFEIARYALSKMKRLTTRAILMQKLIVKLHKNDKTSDAWHLMDEVSRLVDKIEDRFEKAESGHRLVKTYQIIDKTKVLQAMAEAVKATNYVDIRALGEGDRSLIGRADNLQKLYKLSLAITQSFQNGASVDPFATFSTVKELDSQDLRLFAKFGACQEILKN